MSMPPIIPHPSPNHGPRRIDGPPDMLILHYTGMRDGASALARMCDPESQVSAHYMVEEDGRVFQLVADDRRAWHAGASFWAGETDINSRSIGIELVNPGHEWGYRPFPEAQMRALAGLCSHLLTLYPIPAHHVLGHSDIAPSRKQDPGELFDWLGLAMAGIGLWPDPRPADGMAWEKGEIALLLQKFGYPLAADGISWAEHHAHGKSWDESAEAALRAFQRHWVPASLGKGIDRDSVAALRALVRDSG
ncbi:N-acetylmuramoyl-L-alanine amidase [Niveispirillum sp. KHB5.9]|uniref:N-acetylmuramoyl-L-alanine amidase n=1 Tax=Niveispirillum sp. KHB5.9 TaxID=3400269 RepID=UPI003A837EAF